MCNDSGKTAEAPKKPGIPGWAEGVASENPWWEWRVYWRVYIYIYSFNFIYAIPMKCITNRMQSTNVFQDCKIRKHFLHLSSSAPYPKNTALAPGWGSVQKTIWSWVTPATGKKKRLLKEGESAIKSSQPYQGRVRWMSYHDQPLRRLDVEPGWCTLLRSLRAIEDAWHFAKPLGTLGVVLLLAGRSQPGSTEDYILFKVGGFSNANKAPGMWKWDPKRTHEFLLGLLRPVFEDDKTWLVGDFLLGDAQSMRPSNFWTCYLHLVTGVATGTVSGSRFAGLKSPLKLGRPIGVWFKSSIHAGCGWALLRLVLGNLFLVVTLSLTEKQPGMLKRILQQWCQHTFGPLVSSVWLMFISPPKMKLQILKIDPQGLADNFTGFFPICGSMGNC